jgi:hypothetical protein
MLMMMMMFLIMWFFFICLQLADALLPAFKTPSGVPYTTINLAVDRC